MNPKIINVECISPHFVKLCFTNFEIKQFDLKPFSYYPVYQILQDENNCKKATILNNTIVWNEEIDFEPDTLYRESTLL
jgi:hypothetical protein